MKHLYEPLGQLQYARPISPSLNLGKPPPSFSTLLRCFLVFAVHLPSSSSFRLIIKKAG